MKTYNVFFNNQTYTETGSDLLDIARRFALEILGSQVKRQNPSPIFGLMGVRYETFNGNVFDVAPATSKLAEKNVIRSGFFQNGRGRRKERFY